MNSLRVPVFGSNVDASEDTILARSPFNACMSPLTEPTRPLTNSDANEKRCASVFAHFAARAVAGLRVRARRALRAFELGLVGRYLRQLRECSLQLLEARRGGVQGILHLRHGAFGGAGGFAAAFEHFPIEAEAEPDRDQRQKDIAAGVGKFCRQRVRLEQLVEQPDDHRHQHRDGKADDDAMDEGQVAHVGFNQLKHADVGCDPR